ncbi:MAG: cobalt-precorrin-6A reductase [Halofilum sp. (in: g-proteobacteria)]|nr:cobalt-precorrin-6A reductase [Halofilum sp. (in: g-proteobacteria)]
MRLLLLGGTTEATELARRLGTRADIHTTLSLAGRTRHPGQAAVPTRSGGFGGVEGLVAHLRSEGIDRVVDATHPFAAQMSANAAHACRAAGVPLARLSRAPWQPGPGDRWIHVADPDAAARAVADLGPRIFLSVGGRSLGPFASVPGKHWLVRSIDPPEPEPGFSDWTLVRARGPFRFEDELELLRTHRIDALVTKNSGGDATRAKLDAARALARPVVIIDRPELPPVDAVFHDPADVLAWLDRAPTAHHSSAG